MNDINIHSLDESVGREDTGRKENLFEELGNIDPEYIKEADLEKKRTGTALYLEL